MSLEVDVLYFQKRISILVEGLAARFDELECRDFPNKSPEGVIELFKQILKAIADKINTADEKTLPLLFGLLAHYQGLLTYLDNSHTEQTPRGLISIIEELLDRVNPDAQFIASPQAEYNYSIFDLQPHIIRPLGNFLTTTEIDALPPISKSPIQIIMFPRSERDSVLIHAVFGHEVGHLYAHKYLEDEESKHDFGLTLQNKLEEVLKAQPIDTTLPVLRQLKIKAEIQTQLRVYRRRAMEEILSDYVGVIMFGPSALFAAYEVFALNDLDLLPSAREYYPPSRYRIRFLYDVLNEEGFIDAIKKLNDNPKDKKKNYLTKTKELIDNIEKIAGVNNDNELAITL